MEEIEPVFRYFVIDMESEEASRAAREYEAEFGDKEEKEKEIKERYGVCSYFVFLNSARRQKAVKRFRDDGPEKCLDIVAAFREETPPEGFTLVDTGGAAPFSSGVEGMNIFKVDLRTKKGRQFFDEITALRGAAPCRQLNKGEYVAGAFGLAFRLVPGGAYDLTLYDGWYKFTEAGLLAAAPRLGYTQSGEKRGLPDEYKAEPPVSEVGREEFFSLLAGGGGHRG